jgi:FkbM family methyltransferase
MNNHLEGVISVEGQGKKYNVAFPDSSNARGHLLKVLSGEAYGLPEVGTFRPTQIIDIGANVGAAAIFFQHSFPGVPIMCYEPAQENLAYLKRNLSQIPHTEIFECGLSDRDGVTRLFHGKLQCLQHSIHPSVEVDQSDFEIIQLRDAATELLPKLRPGTLLKIDTEGCEMEILRAVAQELKNIAVIYLEYHSEQQRRDIDAILTPTHCLLSSNALQVHRGNVAYISNDAIAGNPYIGRLEVR